MLKFLELIKEKKIIAAIIIVFILVVLATSGLYLLGRKPQIQPQALQPRLVKIENSKAEAIVEITKNGFMPLTIRIKKGEMISFKNNDTKPHQIMSDPHPSHNLYSFLNIEDVLNNGESAVVTFEKTGIFTYHDHLNPLKYKGTVVVQ